MKTKLSEELYFGLINEWINIHGGNMISSSIYPVSASTNRSRDFMWIFGNKHKWWRDFQCWLTFFNLMASSETMVLTFPLMTQKQRWVKLWHSAQKKRQHQMVQAITFVISMHLQYFFKLVSFKTVLLNFDPWKNIFLTFFMKKSEADLKHFCYTLKNKWLSQEKALVQSFEMWAELSSAFFM